MRMLNAAVLAALAIAVSFPGARAEKYALDYTTQPYGPSSTVDTVQAILTTASTLVSGTQGDLGYRVLQITGTFDGIAIVSVAPYETFGLNDNVYIPGDVNFDFAGLAFTLSDGASYAIYWDNVTNSTADPGVPPTGYAECIDGPKCSYSTISNTTQALVATYNSVPVPEPASAALLLAGIGGLTLRHKRMKVFASFFKKKRFLF
jgi:hypothetical protein